MITDPGLVKTSLRFKYDEMLSDTDVSEDYDNDMFFEGRNPKPVPSTQELINQQKGMQLQRGETSINIHHITSHPNRNIAMMDQEQRQELLNGRAILNPEYNLKNHHDISGLEQTLQQSTLQQDIEVGMVSKPCTLLEYNYPQPSNLLKDMITSQNNMQFLNYELTPDTWNLLVNKQVYMTFERLFIEQQLVEVRRREDYLVSKINELER